MILRQKIALAVGGACLLLAAFFPPWAYYDAPGDGPLQPRGVRWGFLLAPPAPEAPGEGRVAYGVAWAPLLVEWSALAGLTFGAVLALREGRGRIRIARKRR